MAWHELEITADLSDALRWVLGNDPDFAEPVVVVAACLDKLAKGFGLSESGQIDVDPLERADLPAPAMALLHHLFDRDAPELRPDALRDRLGGLLVGLAADRDARRKVNRTSPLTDMELLEAGQIYWNLEARGARSRLPLKGGTITMKDGPGSTQVDADIKVPAANKDFATMTWTARVKEGSSKSSGQGFRKQGARLAVLAAQRIISSAHAPLPDLAGPVLNHEPAGGDAARISAIAWHSDEPAAPASNAGAQHDAPAGDPGPLLPGDPGGAQGPRFDTQRILVGTPAGVGADYQPRGFDEDLERLWGDGGDRRIWLRGGPGLGKSYSARRVMQQALADQSPDREALLIWVDSADPATVTRAYAQAMDQLGRLGAAAAAASEAPEQAKARALLGLLATSTWRWLVVLDNADAGSLIGAGLVPPGSNPNGRVLLTTLSQDHRISSHGRTATAALFTAEEAEAYLRREAHSRDTGDGPLALAGEAETRALAETVGRYPLALSVAAATIVANAMTVPDWIEEFTAADRMDTAADAADRGGYQHLTGATWQIALGRASQGLPDGVVERAAMVAAVQDPDGHPGWLWDRPAVAGWVAGGGAALTRHHGMPVALRRLIDHGVVELRGESLKSGNLVIHQLAARAVRELAAAGALAELAETLAGEWLLQLTENPSAAQPSTMRANLRPIAGLPDLPTPTELTVAALMEYEGPPDPVLVTAWEGGLGVLAADLQRGGMMGRARLAAELADVGDQHQDLGRRADAEARYSRAAAEYRQLIEAPNLGDELRAQLLKRLGELERKLNQPDQARARLMEATEIFERVLATRPGADGIGSRLVALVELYEALGQRDRKRALLTRAHGILERAASAATINAPGADRGRRIAQADAWVESANLLRVLGRRREAMELLSRAAESYQRAEHAEGSHEALRDLAQLHCESAEWAQADACLARLVADPDNADSDDLILLASVQKHRGHLEAAGNTIARAARRSSQPTRDSSPTPDPTAWEAAELEQLHSTMRRIAMMEASSEAHSHERWGDAIGLSERLLELAQEDAEANPGDHEDSLAHAYLVAGASCLPLGRYEEALVHFERAVGIFQTLVDLDPADRDAQRQLAHSLVGLATVCAKFGRHEEAFAYFERAVGVLQALVDLDPADRDAQRQLAHSLVGLATVCAKFGRHEEAFAHLERAVGVLQALVDLDPADREVQQQLAEVLRQLGQACHVLGRHEEAAAHLERAAAEMQALVDRDPADRDAQRQLAHSLDTLATVCAKFGRHEEAFAHLERAVGVLQALVDLDPADRDAKQQLAEVFRQLGETCGQLGRHETGSQYLTEAGGILRSLADDQGCDHRFQELLVTALYLLGLTYIGAGRLDEAADCLHRAINLCDIQAGIDPVNRRPFLIHTLRFYASVLRALSRVDEAEMASARADELAKGLPDPGPDTDG